ncbi:mucin-7-like [Drosophila ficusphila]|uniref:mucin-7-like n=1 Tax=Drosophila ficusphila TaxID=30025 RepID=UPI0007E6C00C|nr:mucin-7-like [Drosophila ficusphila]
MPALEGLRITANAASPRRASRPPTPTVPVATPPALEGPNTAAVAANPERPPRPPPPSATADSGGQSSPTISPTWCEGLTLEDVVASLFEADGGENAEDARSGEESAPPQQPATATPIPVGSLGATYEEVSDAEVVTLSSDDEETRGSAVATIIFSDGDASGAETLPRTPPREETPPPSY